MDDHVVGIDLGTTYSAIAYVDDRGNPTIIQNAAGETTTPSVVRLKDGQVTVGQLALNFWRTDEEHVVRWVKRRMGDPSYTFQGKLAEEVSAEILKQLRDDARAQGLTAKRAVITCPAYFNANEVAATKRAGELAGFEVKEIIKEPVAAAVRYGVEHLNEGDTLLVCDLGGGTYDATVVRLEGGVFKPLATEGDRELGGHDWTEKLLELVAEELTDLFGEDPRADLQANQGLYEACEEAKRRLAIDTEWEVACYYQGRSEGVEVTQEQFEESTEHLVERTVVSTEKALTKAKLTWSSVTSILLVGGSSRLRRFAEALGEVSGKTPVLDTEPDLAVVKGAAILARGAVRTKRGGLRPSSGGLSPVSAMRTVPRRLGTRAVAKGNQGKLTVISEQLIARDAEIPTSETREFELPRSGMDYVEVPVVEFDEPDSDMYEVVRGYRAKCLPAAQRGDRIRIEFAYDISGIVTVSAQDVASGQSLDVYECEFVEPNLEELAGAAPRWVVFAVDASWSMEGSKIDHARSAVIDNGMKLLAENPDTRVALVVFASSAEVRCEPTNDVALFRSRVEAVQPTGTTAMGKGIEAGIGALSGAPAGVSKEIVLLTDGMPDSQEETLRAAAATNTAGVTLATLGVGEQDVDINFLKQLSPHYGVLASSGELGAGVGNMLSTIAASADGQSSGGGLRPMASGGLQPAGRTP